MCHQRPDSVLVRLYSLPCQYCRIHVDCAYALLQSAVSLVRDMSGPCAMCCGSTCLALLLVLLVLKITRPRVFYDGSWTSLSYSWTR